MEKIKHRDMPSEDPKKVVFVYDGFKTELTGDDLEEWLGAANGAVEIAWNHGYKGLFDGMEWNKISLR